MSIKNIVTLALALSVCLIVFFIYPSADKSMNAGQSTSLRDAAALTIAHQISVSSDAVLAHYFGKDIVDKIMKQPGCVSVRTYYTKRPAGKSGFLFIGVDKNGKDLAPIVLAGPPILCPPLCGN